MENFFLGSSLGGGAGAAAGLGRASGDGDVWAVWLPLCDMSVLLVCGCVVGLVARAGSL